MQPLFGAQPPGAGEPASQTAEGNACKLNSVECGLVLHVLVCNDCAKVFGAGCQWNPKLLICSASEAKPFFPITPGRQGSPHFAVVCAPQGEEHCALGWIDGESKAGKQFNGDSNVVHQLFEFGLGMKKVSHLTIVCVNIKAPKDPFQANSTA